VTRGGTIPRTGLPWGRTVTGTGTGVPWGRAMTGTGVPWGRAMTGTGVPWGRAMTGTGVPWGRAVTGTGMTSVRAVEMAWVGVPRRGLLFLAERLRSWVAGAVGVVGGAVAGPGLCTVTGRNPMTSGGAGAGRGDVARVRRWGVARDGRGSVALVGPGELAGGRRGVPGMWRRAGGG
jgi:hypothetical protein